MIPDLEETVGLEDKAHGARLGALTQELETAKEKLERTTLLVEQGAEPKARLAEAQTDLDRTENARDAELTAWTSRKHNLGVQVRDVRLAVRRAELNGNSSSSGCVRRWRERLPT